MPENSSLKTARRRHSTAFALILLLALLSGFAWGRAHLRSLGCFNAAVAQSAATPAQPSTPQTPGNIRQRRRSRERASAFRTSIREAHRRKLRNQPQPETRITKAQAKELFRSVDVILSFASRDTGLPIQSQVKRHLITRESMEKYVDKRMKDDKDTQRLEQSRLVLEKFGLLPPGYDLHGEFLRLLGEQVAAYYDPKTKSVNLLDWVPPDTQKPVLAHELTHALQDQKIGLEKWERAGAKDDKPLPDPQEYVVEEAQAARQCVAEGQAMVVLLDYTLAPMGKDVVSAPEIFDAMRAGMADNKDSPVFAAAPMFLRESLMMPYTWGTDFVRTVLTSKGKDAAYGGMLENPPVDTRQVMQPETYLLEPGRRAARTFPISTSWSRPTTSASISAEWASSTCTCWPNNTAETMLPRTTIRIGAADITSPLMPRPLRKTRSRCCTFRAGIRLSRRARSPSCMATMFPSAIRRSTGS